MPEIEEQTDKAERKRRHSHDRHHRSSRGHSHTEQSRDRRHGHHHHRRRHRDSSRDVSSRRRRRNHDRERSPPRDDEQQALVLHESSRSRTVTKPSAEEPLFVIDTRGDPLIMRYGSNDRSKVPRYRRLGGGKVLGSDERLVISRDGPREEFTLGAPPREGGSVFREKHVLLLKAGRATARRFRSSRSHDVASSTNEAAEEFVAVGRPRNETSRRQNESDDSADEGRPSYRSIHGMAKRHEFSDSDLDSGSDSPESVNAEPALGQISTDKARSIELSRRVKAQPEDVEAWLELVDVQDRLLSQEFGAHDRTIEEHKSLADVHRSMLESALPHAKTASDRERLTTHMLRYGLKTWPAKEVSKRLDKASQDYPDSFELWRMRTDFEMCNMSTFTYDGLKAIYIGRMQHLSQRARMVPSIATTGTADLYSQMIYAFLRLTIFLQASGYKELAVASWQLLLETTFSRPRSASSGDKEAALSSLQDFWESEMPRIGQKGAKGWAAFEEGNASQPVDGDDTAAPLAPADGTLDRWATQEMQRAEHAQIPARTLDDDGDEDPFRVVMFSDIHDMLVWFPQDVIPQVTAVLLDSFLLFCRKAPVFRSSAFIETALRDPFITPSDSKILTAATQTNKDEIEEGSQKQHIDLSGQSHHYAASPEDIFTYADFLKTTGATPDADPIALKTWSATTIRQLVRARGIEELAALSLVMEWQEDKTSVKKAAKALLKLYPSNTSLYNTYALAEHANGNEQVAAKVLAASTNQDLDSKGTTRTGSSTISLWTTWAWLELKKGKKSAAISRLSFNSSEDDSDSTLAPSQTLKTRQHLSSSRDYQLSSGNLAHSAAYAEAFTLFTYLTSSSSSNSSSEPEPQSELQGNITAAMRTVETYSEELRMRGHSESLAHERYLQFAARLLSFHVAHGPYRPIYVRQHLRSFITLFPRNTLFLHFFARAQTTVRIDDPIRQILRETILNSPAHDTVQSRLFAISHEMRVGNVYSVNSAYEHALQHSPVCKGSVSLWRSFIRYSFDQRELQPTAKDVFYRAIRECPWSKDLYLEAFTTLSPVMEPNELRGVFHTLQAKGLRIHVDLKEEA